LHCVCIVSVAGQLDLPIFDAEAWNVLVESNMFIAKNELVVLDIIGQGRFAPLMRLF